MVRLDQFVANLEKSGLVAASTIERATRNWTRAQPPTPRCGWPAC